LPIGISFGGAGLKTYQIHSLTVSYYEAGTALLCFHHLHTSTEEGAKILDRMEDNRGFILDDGSAALREEQTMDRLNGRRSSISDFATMLYETGLLDHDKVKRVRTERNNFLHSPAKLLSISDWERIVSMSERCLEATEDLDRRITEDIDLHAIYGSMTDRDRTSRRY